MIPVDNTLYFSLKTKLAKLVVVVLPTEPVIHIVGISNLSLYTLAVFKYNSYGSSTLIV